MFLSLLGPGAARRIFLPSATIAVFASATAAAQSPGATRIGSIFVTATRMSQPIEQLIADVTVIDAEEIARSGAQSLTELLQRQAGIEIMQNGGPGSTSGVFIRGANRGQTLLLIDGLRVSSASVGAPSLEAVPLGPDRAHRDPARPGLVAVRRRRDRRRHPDLHAHSPRSGSPAMRARDTAPIARAHCPRGCPAGMGALRFSLQAGGRRSDGFNATTDAASFIFNPDRDGYESDDIGANATLTFAPGHEATVQVLRNRLDAQFDGGSGLRRSHADHARDLARREPQPVPRALGLAAVRRRES